VIYPPAPAATALRQAEVEAPKGQLIFLPRKDEAGEKAKPEAPLPGKEAGGFRPLQPEDRARAIQPVPVEVPKPPEPRPPAVPPKEPPPAPMNLVSRGQQAFAAQEYARAERLFQQATRKETQTPLGYFLLAQAQFALAKYEEAMRSIDAGLQLQPDWPKSDFRPEALYGTHRADFQEQLDHLRQLVTRKPSDPALLFILAYELWFAGRQQEAKLFFQRARDITLDKTGIDLFLQAK
jgi:tetratricopeptide (TPR) repeat protein